jgi:hypothetical protein
MTARLVYATLDTVKRAHDAIAIRKVWIIGPNIRDTNLDTILNTELPVAVLIRFCRIAVANSRQCIAGANIARSTAIRTTSTAITDSLT